MRRSGSSVKPLEIRARDPRSCPAAAAAYIAVLVLSGCGLADVEQAGVEAGETVREIARVLPPDAPRFAAVRVVERPYLGLRRQDAPRRQDLPEHLEAEDAVTLTVDPADDDAALARRVEAASLVPVRLVGAPRRTARPAFAATLLDDLSPGGDVWTGPLRRLLDGWAQAEGYEWTYDPAAGRVAMVRDRTTVFTINALAGAQRYSATSTTQDQEGGGGRQNLTSQTVTTTAEFSPWREIDAQLKALVAAGTTVAVAPSSASVTVRGLPRELARVRRFLAYLNREVLRPVTLSVHVYTVNFRRSADYELGLTGVLERIGRGAGRSVSVRIGGGGAAVIAPARVGADTLEATVRALSEAGTASRVLSADVPSLNGKPAQFFELFRESYLREIRTNVNEGVQTTQLLPGSVSSGFAMSYLPRITGPDEVLVRLIASLQDRPEFDEFTTAEHRIQLPRYGSRAVQATQKVRRGETLVISGFRDRASSTNLAGTAAAWIPLPEGKRDASLRRSEGVLLLRVEIGAPLGVSESAGATL